MPAENGTKKSAEASKVEQQDSLSRLREADWPAVLFFIHIHLLAIYGLKVLLYDAKLITVIFFTALILLGVLGVTTGAHRLWAHRTYTANSGLRILLMLCQTLVGQGPVYDWVQVHRLHHAHFGTDGDPYNHNKGFAYAHFLTRIRTLSPYQQKLKDSIDMSDLEADPVVMFQKRFYYWLLYPVVFLLLPINAPLEYWDDTVISAIFVMGFLRYGLVLHAAWLVDSAICIWGLQPGEKCPADTNLVFVLTKSYWPHYHYLMPQDYKSGEYGSYDGGCSTTFIRVWAALGWASGLRTIETSAVQKALAEAAIANRPVSTCLVEAAEKQQLHEEHYLLHS